MSVSEQALAKLIAKDEIRELVQLYSRAVDRRDPELLRSLYTKNGIDNHSHIFSGTADELVEYMRKPKPWVVGYTGHYIANHLISIDSPERAEGEVYSIAYHHYLGNDGSATEEIMLVRYLDQYALENGRWRFAQRDLMIDQQFKRPIARPELPSREDASYQLLKNRIFAKGQRS